MNTEKLKAYWDELYDPEYVKFHKMWTEMSFEAAKEYAESVGVTIPDIQRQHNQVAKLRLQDAVLEKLGIQKFKKQYRSNSARRALYLEYSTEDRG